MGSAEGNYWDLGEENVIHPSKESLSKILEAIIRLHGKITCTHSSELGQDGKFRYPAKSCAVLFRIWLPDGKKEQFEEITGFTLTEPPRIGVS